MFGRQTTPESLDGHLPTISFEDHGLLYNSNHNQLRDHSHSPAPSVSPPAHYHDLLRSPALSALNAPGTPSYAGSRSGTPNNWTEADENLISYQAQQQDTYNPSDYDLGDNSMNVYPGDHSPFDLINDNFDFGPSEHNPTVSVVPAEMTSDQQLALNQHSPASSAGFPTDHRSPSPMRSRASSLASSHGSPHISFQATEPQWGVTAPSPPANAPSPHTGSRSPPTLLIPDTANQPTNQLNAGGSFGIGVNGNGNNGGLAPDGPGINLIPATPISGGINAATNASFAHPFRRAGSPHGQSSRVSSPVPSAASNRGVDVHNMWSSQQMDANVVMRVPSPSQSPAMQPQFLNSNSPGILDGSTGMLGGGVSSNPGSPFTAPSPSVSPHPSPIPAMLDLNFGGGDTANQGSLSVPPYNKHQRSKSETYSQTQRPSWALGANTYQSTADLPSPFDFPSGSSLHSNNNLNSNNMQHLGYLHLPAPTSADSYGANFPRIDPPQMSHATTFGPGVTPNFNLGEFLDPNAIRRARSDAGYGHRRGAKSEDLSQFASSSLNPGLTVDHSGLLAPPNHPSLMVPMEQYGRGRPNGFGHHRRASSGSRSSMSGASSARASPYPSPNASPMINYAELQPDPSGMAKVNMESLNLRERTTPPPVLNVARPHVTTSATQAASATRRTSEATFTCPVPGCGSTFTRHFNLKGHLRSHNDERPFRCKWPGCEKGFARQHDCKRHEQLHLNIRPYTCEGCSRTFARMDALNRHLRSEGGAECAKHQQPLTDDRVKTEAKPVEPQQWTNPGGARSGAVLT